MANQSAASTATNNVSVPSPASDADQAVTTEHVGVAESQGEAASFYGIEAGGIVALAMIVVFAIMLKMRVPALIASMLDKKIAGIREQLDTAAGLRKEAEALKAEYEKKTRDADKEIAAMTASAEKQAAEIVAKAKADATQMIARHTTLAEERIAVAEAQALADVRHAAAQAATKAAASLIAGKHDAANDKSLVDDAIAAVAKV